MVGAGRCTLDTLGRDRELLRSISEGNEPAFVGLMDRHEPSLVRLARCLIPEGAGPATVVEQTWLSLLGELGRFDGAAPLKVWLHGRLVQVIRARYPEVARALDEGAQAPFDAAVDAARFSPPGDRWHGHWRQPPKAWSAAQGAQLAAAIEVNLRALPPLQRAIAILHDTEELAVPHICSILGIDEASCRRSLHVARSRLWAASEDYLAKQEAV